MSQCCLNASGVLTVEKAQVRPETDKMPSTYMIYVAVVILQQYCLMFILVHLSQTGKENPKSHNQLKLFTTVMLLSKLCLAKTDETLVKYVHLMSFKTGFPRNCH